MSYIVDEKIDMVFVQETWIRKSDGHLLTEIKEYGYEVITYRKTRRLDLGGGVAVLYRNNLKVCSIKSKIFPSFEHLECQLTTEQGPVKFINIYRPDYSKKNRFTVKKFLSDFYELLSGYTTSSIPHFLVGDYNIHVEQTNKPVSPDWNHHQIKQCKDAKALAQVLYESNFCQLVEGETHDLCGTLDLLISPIQSTSTITNLRIGYKDEICESDHYPVFFSLNIKPAFKEKMITLSKRDFTNFDLKIFNEDVMSTLITEQYDPCDINTCVRLYQSTLKSALDRQCPISSKCVHRRPNQMRFDRNLQDMKRRKRSVERQWKKNKTPQCWQQLKDVKLEYKNALFATRSAYISDYVDNIDRNDHKKIHKAVNYLTGTAQERILPSYTSKEELANQMTKFYSSKVSNIRQEIPTCDKPFESTAECLSSFTSFKLLDSADLKSIVFGMKPKGHPNDPAPVWLVKDSYECVAPLLLDIINQSLHQGIFPDSLKHAVITPIIKDKNENRESFRNYRPVSNLTFLSKLLEKCASTQLQDYLHRNNLYPNFQSAYRKYHSCETALLKIVNDIQEEVANKKMVAMIALDLSSAFDTIDHAHLLHKLKTDFGILDNVLKWIDSYLSNRTFAVRIIDIDGKPVLLIYGVPQGSILGPLLFILYMHDLVQVAEAYGLKIHLYADDAELYIGFSPLTESSLTMIKVKNCVNDVQSWMNANFLKINIDKTNVMFYGRTQELNLFDVYIDIDGEYFESSPDDVMKTLGIYLDSRLSMHRMVAECCKSCYFQLKKLQSIRRFLNTDKRILMVHSHILSRLDYCNVLLAGLSATQTKKLQRALNAAVRFIYNLRKTQSVTHFSKMAHFLPVKYRIMYKSCLTIYKTVYNLAPKYLDHFSVTMVRNREYMRSTSDYLMLQYPESKDTLRYHLVTSWNILPLELRCIPYIEQFKASLKTYFFTQAYC